MICYSCRNDKLNIFKIATMDKVQCNSCKTTNYIFINRVVTIILLFFVLLSWMLTDRLNIFGGFWTNYAIYVPCLIVVNTIFNAVLIKMNKVSVDSKSYEFKRTATLPIIILLLIAPIVEILDNFIRHV